MNEGLELGHAMAAVAADNAGAEWKRKAYEAFVNYAKTCPYFVTEDVRAANADLPSPPDTRAWGQIALMAKREKIVSSYSLVRAKSRSVHGMIVTMWQSNLLPKTCYGSQPEIYGGHTEVTEVSS
jgi:hypothetical protein